MTPEDTRVGLRVRHTQTGAKGVLTSHARLVEDAPVKLFVSDLMYLKSGVYLTKVIDVFFWEVDPDED